MHDRALARYQAALMTLLARTDIDDDERMRRLRTDAAFAPYADYVASFERPFVALGANILGTWARPTGKGALARKRRSLRRDPIG